MTPRDRLAAWAEAWLGDRDADRVVPPSGQTAWLTVASAGAMAFLAVFALALAFAAGTLADRWSQGLSDALTLRMPTDATDAQVDAALTILRTTPGVAGATVLDDAAQAALLAPWLGDGVPVDDLPLPRLIDVALGDPGPDVEGLRLRLAGEAPRAVLDDHGRWRAPLVDAAARLRLLSWATLGLIAGVTAAIVTLAAQAALAANAEVIRVLRLIGARDAFVVRAFARRFTLRALAGAVLGTGLGALALAALPGAGDRIGLLAGIGIRGAQWTALPLVPILAAAVAALATRGAAARMLRRID
ncbi:cell division protein FtsX [Jannaschia sp. LMIT008]|uniref:cell division protein FtsX n=1 Tax=Jannaschia maritima TaxID=3032585 RepID=UPI002811EA88|nr:FtsX-like permease family protein [Jannaschia sp. LMIT008]